MRRTARQIVMLAAFLTVPALCMSPAYAATAAAAGVHRSSPAIERAEVDDQFIGRTVADMRVEVAGEPLLDPAVLELIETRVGGRHADSGGRQKRRQHAELPRGPRHQKATLLRTSSA